MPGRWCVNFDLEAVLRHGLATGMWLMQYQYSHDGHDFQGHSAQLAATAANWNILMGVKVGDSFAAYLPNSTFYAIGQVIEPRVRARHVGAAIHTDTVARAVRDHRHRSLDGVVRYCDAVALYEDFTDQWRCPNAQAAGNQPNAWQYPQRIDVREWEHVVPHGVQVDGLSSAAPLPAYRRAVFEVPEEFFERILKAIVAK
jgi:hypothetical protein